MAQEMSRREKHFAIHQDVKELGTNIYWASAMCLHVDIDAFVHYLISSSHQP